ncbi:CD27 antigen-like [Polyodon spathula]|uniref:CD27 antigen-like n=1 Tax=Polyodon spathula TaxID=7913 RepID=UPI001B7DF72A|nr:CD27 antigen-like [Polyodon spathula]
MTFKCTEWEDTRCEPCPVGSYNPMKNRKSNCERCRTCEGGFSYEKQCTRYSNAVCKCNSGLQCMDEECSRCIYPAVITTPAETSVTVKWSTPAKEPAAKLATPAKKPAENETIQNNKRTTKRKTFFV